MTDPISDLVVRINNARKAHLPSINFNTSKLTTAISEVLQKEGYIESFKVINVRNHKTTIINLKYKQTISTINGIKQISKPGLRIYQSCDKLPYVLKGLGTAIISTNKGILTDKQARAAHLGGEVLIYVW